MEGQRNKARLFSDAELRDMERRTIDRLMEALDAGDVPRAKELAQRMHNEASAMHDLYRNKTAALQSFIGRTWGDDALATALKESAKSFWLPILAKMPKAAAGEGDTAPTKKRIRMFVAGLRGHLQPLAIREEEDRVVVQMRPCGSGGRLVLEGHYEGPNALYTIRNPHTMTFGRKDYPAYCAHEASMEELAIEADGAPFMVVEPASRLGHEPCSFFLYKDPAKVPAHYFERVGKTKPNTTNPETPETPGERPNEKPQGIQEPRA
jgi:hypothetical protein